MVKLLEPRSYRRCSKRHPSISRWTAALRTVISRICLNVLALAVFTAALSPSNSSSVVVCGTAQTCSFTCSHRKKNPSSQTWRSRRAMNRPWTSNPPSWICRVHPLPDIFLIILERRPLTHSYRKIFKNPRYHSFQKIMISLSIQTAWEQIGPKTSPTISAQSMTMKRT